MPSTGVLDVKGASGRLHHISLWVDNREDVLRAADVLAENGIFIEAGPSKHNNSQGFYLYSYEPSGNRVEWRARAGSRRWSGRFSPGTSRCSHCASSSDSKYRIIPRT